MLPLAAAALCLAAAAPSTMPKAKSSANGNRSFRAGNSSANPDRKTTKGGQRDRSTIKRLNMYKSGKAIRNKKGAVVGGDLMGKDTAGNQAIGPVARVQPDRRWFGNTRVVGQKQLERFREELGNKVKDPFSVVLRQRKLPMGLLSDPTTVARMNLLTSESFSSTFGPGKTRKRPKLGAASLGGLLENAAKSAGTYADPAHNDGDLKDQETALTVVRDPIFGKGQSRRIWGELYKVLDCSDVVIQVLDARNPMGTRSMHVEKHLAKNARHKHLILVLNKCDLVPTWATKRWVQVLSEEYPTLAFHASINNSFGKGSLINLLRQFSQLHADKKSISVGIIGYPNVGKSSVINTLMRKAVCKAAPVPGETKVWQYITLMKRINLIDCPGVVYDTGEEDVELVLKGVTRSERLPDPEVFIPTIIERVKREYIARTYGIHSWTDSSDFLAQLARKTGKMLKGGEANETLCARMVINDFQRGRLPYFVPPPKAATDGKEAGVAGGEGGGEVASGEGGSSSSSSSSSAAAAIEDGETKAVQDKEEEEEEEEEERSEERRGGKECV